MEREPVGLGTAVNGATTRAQRLVPPQRAEPEWRTLAGTAQLLRRVPSLRSAPRSALNALADRVTPCEVAAGEVLYGPDDPADRFYVVASGRLVERLPGANAECYYEAGMSVGDATLLGADTHLATVTALVPSRLWSLTRGDLDALRDAGHRFTAAETQTATVAHPDARRGFGIDAVGVSRSIRGGHRILNDVTFTVAPGELLAIVGGSGAGKTTLLEALAGVARQDRSDRGSIRCNGTELADNIEALRTAFGFVPQDDIIHKELTLETTLRYAARLRLPEPITTEEIEAPGTRDDGRARPLAACPGARRVAVWRAAPPRQHRRRAADATERVLSRRAAVGA